MFDKDLCFKSARELIDCFLDDNTLTPKSLFDVSPESVLSSARTRSASPSV